MADDALRYLELDVGEHLFAQLQVVVLITTFITPMIFLVLLVFFSWWQALLMAIGVPVAEFMVVVWPIREVQLAMTRRRQRQFRSALDPDLVPRFEVALQKARQARLDGYLAEADEKRKARRADGAVATTRRRNSPLMIGLLVFVLLLLVSTVAKANHWFDSDCQRAYRTNHVDNMSEQQYCRDYNDLHGQLSR